MSTGTKPVRARRGAFTRGLLIGLVIGVAAYLWWSGARDAARPAGGA